MRRAVSAIIALLVLAAAGEAQEHQVELHPELVRTVQSDQNSWGGGAAYQLTFGAKHAPVRPALSLGADLVAPSAGPSTTSLSLDALANLGGGAPLTPFVGASAGSNWTSGSAALGLFTIAGLQYTIGNGPWSVNAQARWGYVKDQDHQWIFRAGVGHSK